MPACFPATYQTTSEATLTAQMGVSWRSRKLFHRNRSLPIRSRARLPCSLLVQSSCTEAPSRRPALLYAYGDAPSPALQSVSIEALPRSVLDLLSCRCSLSLWPHIVIRPQTQVGPRPTRSGAASSEDDEPETVTVSSDASAPAALPWSILGVSEAVEEVCASAGVSLSRSIRVRKSMTVRVSLCCSSRTASSLASPSHKSVWQKTR
jgi:hypothetical protein